MPVTARALAACALLVLAPAAWAQEAPSGWEPVEFRLDAELRLVHADNLYHVQRRHEAEFGTETDRYERFHRMRGPSDMGARLSLELGWRFKHASKRAVGVSLRTRQVEWKDNPIASHEELRLEAAFDVSPSDRLRLRVDRAPEHFRKNLKYEAFPGITVYERADVTDTGVELAYRREWSKRWSTTLAYERGRRDHAAPFDGRDQRRETWSASATCELTKRLDLEAGFARGSTSTPTSVESGVPKDRSHDDDELSLGFDADLRHGWRLRQRTTRTTRDYTTREAVDATRFGRTDRRWGVEVDVEKELSKRWSVGLDAEWTRHDAGRESAMLDDDEYGFEDLGIGVRAAFRLSASPGAARSSRKRGGA